MIVSSALRDATRRLEPVSDTARLDAELLMAHAFGVSRSDLLLRHGGDDVPDGFAGLLARRMTAEPVAYITGVQEFYGREFAVTSDVLIPRSDSETIVEAAFQSAPSAKRVLDCGTGSGALLLTVLAERPDSQGVGIDQSADALQIASANAEKLGLSDRAQMITADWTTGGWSEDLGRFDLILANPPYVEQEAKLDSSVRDFEPAKALFSGPEGLDDYRILIPQLPDLLLSDGVAVLEIGASQAQSVSQIAENTGFQVDCRRDLGNRPRALVLTLGLGK